MNISATFDIGTRSRMKKATYIYLTQQEKKAVIKETNPAALCLLNYYFSVIGGKNYVINDKKTATATGLPLRSVQDNRRLLARKNLFKVIKRKDSDITWYMYCARKEGVYCNTYFDKLFGYSTIRDVYWNYTRKQFVDILVKNKLNPMETQDITDLLDRYHDTLSQKGKARSEWSSL